MCLSSTSRQWFLLWLYKFTKFTKLSSLSLKDIQLFYSFYETFLNLLQFYTVTLKLRILELHSFPVSLSKNTIVK